MKLAFATGSDSKLFLNLAILADSFARHMEGETLHVCDFGFNEAHRAILTATGHLKPAPPHLEKEEHTWKRKAAITDYFTADDPPPDAVVWFDADMVLLKPLAAEIRRMAEEMRTAGEDVAVCTDSNGDDIAGFIAANETPETDLTPFRALMEAHGTDPAAPYLNTGFFILPMGAFATAWGTETLRQAPFLLFEQNTFNALAAAPAARIRRLDPAVWNVHGELLADADASGGGPAAVLHTTSKGAHHTMTRFNVDLGETAVSGDLKIFARPDLMKVQGDHLMHFLVTHQALVAEFGV